MVEIRWTCSGRLPGLSSALKRKMRLQRVSLKRLWVMLQGFYPVPLIQTIYEAQERNCMRENKRVTEQEAKQCHKSYLISTLMEGPFELRITKICVVAITVQNFHKNIWYFHALKLITTIIHLREKHHTQSLVSVIKRCSQKALWLLMLHISLKKN